MSVIAILNKAELKISDFAGTDDSSPMLTNILVHRPDGDVRLDATDSYMAILFKARTPEEGVDDFKPFLVPARTLKMLYKLAGKHKQPETNKVRRLRGKTGWTVIDEVELHETYATIPTLGVRIDYDTEEEPDKFPKLDKVLADVTRSEQNEEVSVNHKLLSTATSFVSSVDSSAGEIKIKLGGKYSPIEVSGKRARAIVLPLRG